MMKRLYAAAFAVLACILAGCQSAAPPHEYAVYGEYSDKDLAMVPGWNTRVFNRREVQEGTSIALDDKTGVITLAPGTYHVSASSLIAYYDPKIPSLTIMKELPVAGYARLANLADAEAETKDPAFTSGAPSQSAIDKSNAQSLAISTGSNADLIPSLIETYLKIEKPAQVVLQHQVGADVKGIYLHVNGNGSAWHVFARISFERM
jgi:hypothetical protein